MRLFWTLLLLCVLSVAQAPPVVLITNACCASLSRIDFSIQGAAGSVSLPYGVSSTAIKTNAGASTVNASAGADLNFTSSSFVLAQDKVYTTALYGNLGNPKLVGPIENLDKGDPKKIRVRFGLLSTYVQQNPPPHSQIRLRTLT